MATQDNDTLFDKSVGDGVPSIFESQADALAEFENEQALVECKVKGQAQDDGFDELEELLGEAMIEKAAHDKIKAAKARVRGGFGISEADAERIRQWDLKREWTSVANVCLFRRYECSCGAHYTVFEGMMLEQNHRTDKTGHRWMKQEGSVANLPNSSAIRKTPTPMCQRCANSKGFSLRTDLEWEIP